MVGIRDFRYCCSLYPYDNVWIMNASNTRVPGATAVLPHRPWRIEFSFEFSIFRGKHARTLVLKENMYVPLCSKCCKYHIPPAAVLPFKLKVSPLKNLPDNHVHLHCSTHYMHIHELLCR